MKPLILILLAAPMFSSASTITIKSQIYVDDVLVSAPRISTRSGEPAMVSQTSANSSDHVSLKVTAEDSGSSGILLKMDLEYLKGDRLIKSYQETIAQAGQPLSLDVRDEDGLDVGSLNVTATRE